MSMSTGNANANANRIGKGSMGAGARRAFGSALLQQLCRYILPRLDGSRKMRLIIWLACETLVKNGLKGLFI